MKNNINIKGFSAVEILVSVVIVGLVGALGWLLYDRQINTENNKQAETPKQEAALPQTLSKGNFGDSGEYGNLQAEGYTTIIKRSEPFCEQNCKQYNYVFFNIARTENTNIFNFIQTNEGNSFVQGDKAIGMGCVAEGQIYYYNDSDANGEQEYKISKEDTTALLRASAGKPAALEIEKLQYSSGKGASPCSSLFTFFKLIK